jgi:hypothetical protein
LSGSRVEARLRVCIHVKLDLDHIVVFWKGWDEVRAM